LSRLIEGFKIRHGEERMSVLLVCLMLVTAAGSAIGGNATEALFFARFGTDQLPAMYIILGLFSFVTAMAVTGMMGRVSKQRLYGILPLVLGVTLIGERLIIPFNLKWFFAAIWLVMNVINSLQALLTWGLASAACDTRQAKRLFPLFSAGGILGTILGGLITQPLATWLHSENLLLLWAGTMFISFILGRALSVYIHAVQAVSHTPRPRVIDEMQRGYQFVRRSSIMRLISYSAILFSVCYFSLALPFSRGATAQFPDADRLAGFLGQFQSLSTGMALLVSLILANRLFARFGILPMLLLFPVIYLVGFGVLAFASPFALLVAARFAQMAYMYGIAGPAWQAVFNIVPPERRDQVRAFVSGVPEQAGTFIAGLILFVGEQALQPQQLYLVGFAAAAFLVYIIWRASQAYGLALVDALRTGQPQVFFSEEQPFGGSSTDAAAVSVAVRGLSDPDPGLRRVSAEILGHVPAPEAADGLINALLDQDTAVRVAALKGLAQSRVGSALLEISGSLSDPDPDVRCQAIVSIKQLAASSRGIEVHVKPLLTDANPLVRAQAALALLDSACHAGARETLYTMADDANPQVRAQSLNALSKCGDEPAFQLAVSALDDVHPLVRKAAAAALVEMNPPAALNHLIRHLNDDDSSIRCALAEWISKIGDPALEPLVEALANPSYEDGVLMALEQMPVQKAARRIRAHAETSARTALHYHQLALALEQNCGHELTSDGRLALLFESLQDKSKRSGLNALRALGLVTARETVAVAVENLRSREAAQRSNAIETLDAVGDRETIRPLLVLWEAGEHSAVSLPEDWLMRLLNDPYSWLRACAVMVAAQSQDVSVIEKLRNMSFSDPDEFVRTAAENVLMGDNRLETLTTLSLMERILFLRRVPLFADLPPADLKQVAAIASEIVFLDGQTLAHQGELGTEMYIVVSGQVRVMMAAENQKEWREVARRQPGDYVGEMAIISQEPRIATLIADGAVRALCLKQKQFEGILRERPEIGLAMMRILCQRLKEASIRLF